MPSFLLRTRIRAHGMSDSVAILFSNELLKVARLSGPVQDTEAALIQRLVQLPSETPSMAAPFDALWQCSDLFLEACITVAVTQGGYTVDKARHIAQLAHRLGFSARQLSELERVVIGVLVARSIEYSAAGPL